MTERGRHDVERDARRLRIGPSTCRWNGDVLTIDLDEIAVPWPARLRGCLRVQAPCRVDHVATLAPGHRWFPIAPRVRVEVDLDAPARCWQGDGYLDANHGDAPLETAFTRWDWTRAHLSGARSLVVYDIEPRGATRSRIGLAFDADGHVTPVEAPSTRPLPRTAWGIARGDCGVAETVRRTLTDAPFYARSLVDGRWRGEPVAAMHESLSLDRFATPWVQAMLPFRMPRRVISGSR